MRHKIACSAMVLTALVAVQPAHAQDNDGPQPAEQSKSFIQELLDQMAGLPDPAADFDTTKPVVGFGFQIVEDGVRIAEVMDGSAAEAAGLKTDMFIDTINGVGLSTFDLKEIAKLIAAIDGEITFAIRDTGDIKLHKAPIAPQGS